MNEIYNPSGQSSWSFREKRIAHFLGNSSSIRLGMMKIIVVMIAATLLTSFTIKITYASSDELGLFDEGYQYYLSYQPKEAVDSFHIFLNKFPNSSVKDAALFWLGRSLVKLQSFEAAKNIFLQLKDEMPDSPFKGYVDSELKTMNSGAHEIDSVNQREQGYSEIQTLRDEKVRADRTLLELTEERDNLKSQLEEERMKNKELQAKADRFDNELRDILTRLQTLQTAQESKHSRLTILQNVHGAHDPAPQEATSLTPEAANDKGITKDSVEVGERKPEKQQGTIQQVQKEAVVARQASPHTLELIANEETWIYVTIDEKETRERILKPGARVKWTAKSGFSLKIGNAGGIKVLFNGREIGPLGDKGKVVKLKLPSFKISNGSRQSSNVL